MYDVIIIGLGSMGSSTLYQLAKKGVKVLGIEQFGIGHDKGSYSGQSRIVRKAYFEHPDYVPLLDQAYKGWDEIHEQSGTQLFFRNGLAYYGSPDHSVMEGIKSSAIQYDIELNKPLNNPNNNFFKIPKDSETLFEPDAGFALSEESIKTYTNEAQKLGATISIGEKVISWKLKNGYIEVQTDKSTYKAKKLVLTTGSYVKDIIPTLSTSLTVTGQILTWIKVDNAELFQVDNFSCWVIADEEFEGVFYGFPILDKKNFGGNGYLKLAQHAPAEIISPNQLNSFDESKEVERMQLFIQKYLPKVGVEVKSQSRCMYTNTNDENFIIDFLPDTNNQVIIASGFSGHGFKFVPVVGEIISNMAVNEKVEQEIKFLSLKRLPDIKQ